MTNTMRRAANVIRRRLSSSVSTKAVASHQNKHDGTNVIQRAVVDPSNPRAIPRAAVWAGTAGFVGFMAYRRLDAHEKTEDRKSILAVKSPEIPPMQSQVSKTVAESSPIVMNAGRYDKLRDEGLGVDHGEWKEKKKNAPQKHSSQEA